MVGAAVFAAAALGAILTDPDNDRRRLAALASGASSIPSAPTSRRARSA
jgi:hypothetical protein